MLQTRFDLRHLPHSIRIDALNNIMQYQQWSILHAKGKHCHENKKFKNFFKNKEKHSIN